MEEEEEEEEEENEERVVIEGSSTGSGFQDGEGGGVAVVSLPTKLLREALLGV